MATMCVACGQPCDGRYPLTLSVEGLDQGELRVVLYSDGLPDRRSLEIDVSADGVHAFARTLACGAPYTLAVEKTPENLRCRLLSDQGTSGPDRSHTLQCFPPPATCEALFVEPTSLVEFEDALGGPPWDEDQAGSWMSHLIPSPKDAATWYAATVQGTVHRTQGYPSQSTAWERVLDIRSRVRSNMEDGIVSIVLAPDFPSDPRLFVQYVVEEPEPRRIRLSRFKLKGNGPAFDPDSELVLLEVEKTVGTIGHSGGTVNFGPDGMLYGSIGDGGVQDQPPNNAQDTQTLLGTMYRIDVLSGTEPYAIPADNPFASGGERPGEGLPEVWAWGLRNPYRWDFDPVRGEAWGGDVGQVTWEEINHYQKGKNYGWPVREGPTCYGSQNNRCQSEGLTAPVHAYAQEVGDAVMGGVFYYGSAIPELDGAYLFGDFGSRVLRALVSPYGAAEVVELGTLPIAPVDFTVDADGEVLIAGLSGRVVRMVPSRGGTELPKQLAASGCVGENGQLSDAFIPYTVNAPLWSDGADKARFFALPAATSATVEADGDLTFPPGTVLAKSFALGGRQLETRFMLHRVPGEWVGYSYRWDRSGRTATLVEESVTESVGDGIQWFYPGPSDCMACHTRAAGRSLGLELGQLGDAHRGAAQLGHGGQLDRLVDAEATDPASMAGPIFPALSDAGASVTDRVRGYLHSNCSHCHRAGHPLRVSIDLRFDTPLGEMGVCNPPEQGDLGIVDARVVAPGAPERSVLLARMNTLGEERMPRLGTSVIDREAVDLVGAWIRGLAPSDCP